jgi:hypothetical protein
MTVPTIGRNRRDRNVRRESVVCSLRVLGGLCGAFLFAAIAAAQPYQTLGKAKCINCHDHENEKTWSEKKDGPPPNNHLNALRQLEMPKAELFAKAIGLADPYEAKGSCAGCHGTTLKGNVIDGVTCESCHGAASGYIDVHQQKGAYRQAVGLGLADTQRNPDAWAPMCVRCHVLNDARLIQAGHPSGDDFDVGAKFATVALHWKSIYPNKADIAARARTARAAITASRGPVAAPAMAAPVAASSPAPSVAVGAGAPVSAASAAPMPVAPRPSALSPSAAGMPARASAALRPSAGVAASPASAASSTDPARQPPPLAPIAILALPLSPSAAVAAVQGRVIMLLDSLLRRDARAVVHITPPPPVRYQGPDAELLRLQDEVLALAIESLATAPAAPSRKP